jgi:pimeloyl-ACP methyl ester carboxylesterase
METWRAVLTLAGIGLLATSAQAAPALDKTPDAYARAGTLVAVGHGRSLDLRCSGAGPVTVLLEAGAHADSSSWFRVQPMLQGVARVCSYDRAGYGFSGEGPLPRGLDADVADLHALIGAARLHTPLVLVGHSLGSNIVRRYASVHPADVAGLVLVDPPAQNQARYMPAQWNKDDAELNAQRDAFLAQCERGAEAGELATPPPALVQCIDGPAPWQSPKVAAAERARQERPAFWHTLRSELAQNVPVFAQPVSSAESHDALPLIVLSASDTYADAPPGDRKALDASRLDTQRGIVATSRRGELLPVAHASHDIELDQPQAVADAVRRVLRQLPVAESDRQP